MSKRKSSWSTISFLRTLECFGIPSETSVEQVPHEQFWQSKDWQVYCTYKEKNE